MAGRGTHEFAHAFPAGDDQFVGRLELSVGESLEEGELLGYIMGMHVGLCLEPGDVSDDDGGWGANGIRAGKDRGEGEEAGGRKGREWWTWVMANEKESAALASRDGVYDGGDAQRTPRLPQHGFKRKSVNHVSLPTMLRARLHDAHQTCSRALAALATPPNPLPAHLPPVLHADMLALFALLRASTTKLALAFTPASPSHAAALTPLTDVSNHISALSHCARLYHPSHGLTLRQEATSLARDIIQSVSSLLLALSEIESTHQASDQYIVRVAAVHHLIDSATAPGGFSIDNVAAIRKKWDQEHGSLDDGLSEVADMAKNSSPSSADDPDLGDDGWDQIGLPSNNTMTADEIRIATQVRLNHLPQLQSSISNLFFHPGTYYPPSIHSFA